MKYIYLFIALCLISCQSVTKQSCENKATYKQEQTMQDSLEIEDFAKNKQKYIEEKTHFTSIKEIYEKDLSLHKNRIENLKKYETIYNSKYSLPNSQRELTRIKKEKEHTENKMHDTQIKLQTIQEKINLLNETTRFSSKKD